MKTSLKLIFLIAVVFSSCQNNTKKNQGSVSLRFDWFTSMTFAGEIVGADKSSAKHGLTITLHPGSETTDPIKLVLSGSDNFGCISVEKFLSANEKGANLVAIGVINQISPTVFISKKNKNIKTPKDWIGKTVGVLPGGATEYVYRSLLVKEGLNPSQFKEITVPFDLVTFIADQYDVRPAFIYDEPVSLELQKIGYDLIEPKNYGVTYVGRVYFAKKEYITANPEITQEFVNSMADGWKFSLSDPAKAISILKKFEPKTDTVRDLISLKKAVPYFLATDRRVLTFDKKNWDNTVNELVKLKIIKSKSYAGMIDESFINNYYQNK